LSFSVQKDGTRFANYQVIDEIVEEAFLSWQEAICTDGAPPSMAILEMSPAICRRHEYNLREGNANVIVLRGDDWPYDPSDGRLAVTTMSFNANTGEIYDADMEINVNEPISTDSPVPAGKYDLRSIITHEAGHFLGLSHSLVPGAVMFYQYSTGDDRFQILGSDDMAGICDIYPPGQNESTCNATPRNGFSPDCMMSVSGAEGCSVRPVSPGRPKTRAPSGAVSFLACAFAAFAHRWFRRRRDQPLSAG
jgi:hypothetical protein